MKIYTRKGDRGCTIIGKSYKTPKSDLRVTVLGNLDELNSLIGLSSNYTKSHESLEILPMLQNLIFNIGAEISGSVSSDNYFFHKISDEDVSLLESFIDGIEKKLPSINTFILPGGSKGASQIHLARAVCRRTERSLVELSQKADMENKNLLAFINRTSDLLFVLARLENKRSRHREIPWKGFSRHYRNKSNTSDNLPH